MTLKFWQQVNVTMKHSEVVSSCWIGKTKFLLSGKGQFKSERVKVLPERVKGKRKSTTSGPPWQLLPQGGRVQNTSQHSRPDFQTLPDSSFLGVTHTAWVFPETKLSFLKYMHQNRSGGTFKLCLGESTVRLGGVWQLPASFYSVCNLALHKASNSGPEQNETNWWIYSMLDWLFKRIILSLEEIGA